MNNGSPLRLTHVVFDLNGGGMETLVAGMARRFAGGPVTVSVVTLSGRAGRVGAVTASHLDEYHVARQTPGLSMVFPTQLARLIRRTRPDVVHLHSGCWYKGALGAKLAGVRRVVYTEHGREHLDPPVARWLDRRASRRTDAVVAVSDRLARYLVREVGVDASRVCTIQNGVRTDVFAPGPASRELRARLEIPEDALVLGSVGRLEPVKAYERMIDAFAALRGAPGIPGPLFLVLCGDGSERAGLEAKVRAMGLEHGVRITGWTDEPLDVYRLLDVFALTSLSEGASVSLMEALACGTTPVVMDVGANAEILGPELADLVVPPGDLKAFTQVALFALSSADRRQRAARDGRARVIARYGFERMIAEYERLYRGARPTELGN